MILEEYGPQCIRDQVDVMVPGDLSWSLMSPECDDSPNACFVLTLSRTVFPGVPGRSGPGDPPLH